MLTTDIFAAVKRGLFGREAAAKLNAFETNQAEIAKRPDLAKQRIEAVALLEREGPRLHKERAELQKKYVEIESQYQAAIAELRRKDHAIVCQTAALQHAVNQTEGRLRQSASPAIDDFLDALFEMTETTRHAGKSESEKLLEDAGESERYGKLQRRVTKSYSNSTAVNARLTAISMARDLAEALKLEALDDDQLAQRIEKIRQSIPAASTLEAMELVTA
jgi:hypothetical protein